MSTEIKNYTDIVPIAKDVLLTTAGTDAFEKDPRKLVKYLIEGPNKTNISLKDQMLTDYGESFRWNFSESNSPEENHSVAVFLLNAAYQIQQKSEGKYYSTVITKEGITHLIQKISSTLSTFTSMLDEENINMLAGFIYSLENVTDSDTIVTEIINFINGYYVGRRSGKMIESGVLETKWVENEQRPIELTLDDFATDFDQHQNDAYTATADNLAYCKGKDGEKIYVIIEQQQDGSYKYYKAATIASGLPVIKQDYVHGEMIEGAEYFNQYGQLDTALPMGKYSHQEGYGNTIGNKIDNDEAYQNGHYSHVEGRNNNNLGNYAHIEGYGNNNEGSEGTHIEGGNNKSVAYTIYSHIEGQNNTNTAGTHVHIEGEGNTNRGSYNHIEGSGNTIEENADNPHILCHVQGQSNVIKNSLVDVGGGDNTCEGYGSFVRGIGLTSNTDYQAVFGQYNNSNSNALFIVGNGNNENNKRNALVINKDGTTQLNYHPYTGELKYTYNTDSLENAYNEMLYVRADGSFIKDNDDKTGSLARMIQNKSQNPIYFYEEQKNANEIMGFYKNYVIIVTGSTSYSQTDLKYHLTLNIKMYENLQQYTKKITCSEKIYRDVLPEGLNSSNYFQTLFLNIFDNCIFISGNRSYDDYASQMTYVIQIKIDETESGCRLGNIIATPKLSDLTKRENVSSPVISGVQLFNSDKYLCAYVGSHDKNTDDSGFLLYDKNSQEFKKDAMNNMNKMNLHTFYGLDDFQIVNDIIFTFKDITSGPYLDSAYSISKNKFFDISGGHLSQTPASKRILGTQISEQIWSYYLLTEEATNSKQYLTRIDINYSTNELSLGQVYLNTNIQQLRLDHIKNSYLYIYNSYNSQLWEVDLRNNLSEANNCTKYTGNWKTFMAKNVLPDSKYSTSMQIISEPFNYYRIYEIFNNNNNKYILLPLHAESEITKLPNIPSPADGLDAYIKL